MCILSVVKYNHSGIATVKCMAAGMQHFLGVNQKQGGLQSLFSLPERHLIGAICILKAIKDIGPTPESHTEIGL